MKSILLVTAFTFLALSCLGQDRIVRKNGQVIEARVEEVGLEEVKYYEWQQNGPLLSIAVDMLLRVELENGRVIEFKDPIMDPENYTDQKKSAIKLNFLSPLFESTTFSFERSIRPGRSFETELGFIGLGFNTDETDKSSGLHLAAGYKFLRTPDFYSARMKYAHILKGSYVKPQVLLSMYKNEYDYYNYNTGVYSAQEDNVVSGAFVINLGKQVVYDNSFLIDYSIGVGYGFTTQDFDGRDIYEWRANQYGFFLAGEQTPLVLKFNLKIGLLL